MTKDKAKDIGLSELLEQLKTELMQETPDSPKLFFVESAEIELHVDVKREAKGGIKVSVLQFGGVEAGGGVARNEGHKITLKLVPLVTYEEARAHLTPAEQEAAVPFLTKGAQ